MSVISKTFGYPKQSWNICQKSIVIEYSGILNTILKTNEPKEKDVVQFMSTFTHLLEEPQLQQMASAEFLYL